MPQFKVVLISLDRYDENQDAQFFTYVEATDWAGAVQKAKEVQITEHPDIVPTGTWAWSVFQIAEKH